MRPTLYGIATLYVLCLKLATAQDKKVYEPKARDPVPASTYFNTAVHNEGAYDAYDLGYYADTYADYQNYIFSEHYYAMKRTITNSTLVCANYDVGVNGTYLGVFTCPLPGMEDGDGDGDGDGDRCCGEQYAEFCCYDTSWLTKERLYGGLALVGILIVVAILGVLCYICLGGKRK